MLRNATLVTRRLLRGQTIRTSSGPSQSSTGLCHCNTAQACGFQLACVRTNADVAPKLLVVHPNRKSEALLQEALRLAESYAGSDCPHVRVGPAKRFNVSPSTYFGPGVVESIQEACEAQDPAKLFVNVALSPVQQRNLEAAVGMPVLDRVGLIIEIFAQRARTSEARLQVELAALDYRSSRLVRVLNSKTGQRGGFGEGGTTEVVSARERGRSGSSSGGLGGASGGGQSELQLQRQRLVVRRKALQKKLAEVQRTREVQRAARRRAGKPVVAVVGYTNAGKSSLLQALTRTDAGVQDRLFATLDPALRRVHLPSGREAILSDTVGFISDLPHQLVNAFRATLEEVCEADLLLHVLDASSPSVTHQREAVLQVLKDLGIPETKLQNALLEVWNKTDLIAAETSLDRLLSPKQPNTDSSPGSPTQAGRTPAALHQLAADQARPDSLPGPPSAFQNVAASRSDTIQQASPSHSAADTAISQVGIQSSQWHHLDTNHAASQQQQSGSSSSDRHKATNTVGSQDASAGQTLHFQSQHHTQQQLQFPPQTAAPTDHMSCSDSRPAQQPPSFTQTPADKHQGDHDCDLQSANSASQAGVCVPDHAVSRQQRLAETARPGAVQQGCGNPLALFTSAVTGQGLPELLLEVERKLSSNEGSYAAESASVEAQCEMCLQLSLKWATRELADGAARLGPRLLTHTIVGPPNKQRRPRWRGAGQWESALTQSLRDQSTHSGDSPATDVMHRQDMQDITGWARCFFKL